MAELNNLVFLSLNGFAGQSVAFDWIIVFFADYLAYILVVVSFLSLWFWKIGRLEKIKAFFVATVSVVLLHTAVIPLIRFFYPYPRPFVTLSGVLQLLSETSLSFPSAHATFFFALSTVIYFNNVKLGRVFFALSLIMGLARVVAGVHYPLDIIGGAFIGVCVGFIVHTTVDKLLSRNVI